MRVFSPLFFFLLFAVLGTVQAAQIARFDFVDGNQDGNGAATAADSVGSLIGDLGVNEAQVVWPLDRAGVEIPASSSTANKMRSLVNNTDLNAALAASGAWSFEIWVRIADISVTATGDRDHIIVAATAHEEGTAYSPCDPADGGEGGWRLFQENNAMFFFFIDSGGVCSSVSRPIPAPTSGDNTEALHIVVTQTGTLTNLYIGRENLVGASSTAPSSSALAANYNDGALVSFAPPFEFGGSSVENWDGDIMFFAIYDNALTAGEVQTSREAGIPNSRPQAITASYVFTEDNEIGNMEYGTLAGTDYDDDTLSFTITSLPATGNLTDSADTVINATDLPYDLPDAQFSYIPELNVFGDEVATFTFVANDASSSSLNASVTVNITGVNDVPVATPQTVVVRALVFSPVQLSGTDADGNETVSQARVVSEPNMGGELYQALNETEPGALIAAVPVLLDFNRSLFYRTTTLPPASSGDAILFTETMTFTVLDDEMAESAVETLTLEVQNFMQANPTTVHVEEDARSTISFGAVNLDDAADVLVTVTVLPESGALYQVGSDTALADTDLPVQSTDAMGRFDYLAAPDTYSTSVAATIDFFASRADGFASPSGVLSIIVDEVNDPPVVTGPEGPLMTITVVDVGSEQERLAIPITITDPDPVAADWTVEISATGFGSTFSLLQNETVLDQLEFSFGDSFREPVMIFSGPPAAVQAAVAGLFYESQVPATVNATVIVTDNSETSPGSLSGMYQVQIVVEENPLAEPAGVSSLSLPYLIMAWGAIVGIPVLCCFCICLKKYRSHQQKKAKRTLQMPVCIHCVISQWKSYKRQRRWERAAEYTKAVTTKTAAGEKDSNSSSDSDSDLEEQATRNKGADGPTASIEMA